MFAKSQQYNASLKGASSAEFHINKLLAHSGFKVVMEEKEDSFRLQVIDAFKELPALSEIESDIAVRARKLNLNIPGFVNKTAEDIHRAYEAEQIVKEGLISFWVPKRKENTVAEITLTINIEVDPLIMEICDYYAYIRILEITNVLDMKLEGNIEKCERDYKDHEDLMLCERDINIDRDLLSIAEWPPFGRRR
jgi:hypothetical protein